MGGGCLGFVVELFLFEGLTGRQGQRTEKMFLKCISLVFAVN